MFYVRRENGENERDLKMGEDGERGEEEEREQKEERGERKRKRRRAEFIDEKEDKMK